MNYLVKWKGYESQAEMSLEGFAVLNERQFAEWKAKLTKMGPCVLYFGSNSETEYKSGVEVLDQCRYFRITDEQASFLRNSFEAGHFGCTSFLSPYDEEQEEDEEDEEDDEY